MRVRARVRPLSVLRPQRVHRFSLSLSLYTILRRLPRQKTHHRRRRCRRCSGFFFLSYFYYDYYFFFFR